MRAQVLRGEKPNGRHTNALRAIDARLREVSFALKPGSCANAYARARSRNSNDRQVYMRLIDDQRRNFLVSLMNMSSVTFGARTAEQVTGLTKTPVLSACSPGSECKGEDRQVHAISKSSEIAGYDIITELDLWRSYSFHDVPANTYSPYSVSHFSRNQSTSGLGL